MGEQDPGSLKTLFALAERKRLWLEPIYDARLSSHCHDLADAVESYQKCLKLLADLAIFSPNETVDDVATSDLPYFLVHFYLGDLVQKTSTSIPQERKCALAAARDGYERFLHRLDGYGLLSAAQRKLLARYDEEPNSFSTTGPAAAGNASLRRAAKMANFQLEKELRDKLAFLRARPEYAQEGARGARDEDMVRQVYLANVAYCAHMSLQALEGICREEQVLAEAPEPQEPSLAVVPKDERERYRRGADGFSARLELPGLGSGNGGSGPLLNKAGKLLRPFTLLGSGGNRQELARQVFRPGHNLPTMTIDEYLEEERRRGGIMEGGGEANRYKEEMDDDDPDRADAETMRARAWDDFKEANPKGSGNTLNRG